MSIINCSDPNYPIFLAMGNRARQLIRNGWSEFGVTGLDKREYKSHLGFSWNIGLKLNTAFTPSNHKTTIHCMGSCVLHHIYNSPKLNSKVMS